MRNLKKGKKQKGTKHKRQSDKDKVKHHTQSPNIRQAATLKIEESPNRETSGRWPECGAEAELISSGRWPKCGAHRQNQGARDDSDVLFKSGRIKNPKTAPTRTDLGQMY